jgi:rubrerythrin
MTSPMSPDSNPQSPMISRSLRSKALDQQQQIEEGTELVLRALYGDRASNSSPTNSPPTQIIANPSIPVVAHKLLDSTLKKDLGLENLHDSIEKIVEKDRMHTVVIFSAKADTELGEELYICGSSPLLGDWNPSGALKLHTDNDSYPWWTAVVILPSQYVEYKYVIQNTVTGTARWEEFPVNRKLEPKGAWEVTEDGTFGKREQRLFTKRNVETLKKELQQKDDQIKQHNDEKRTLARELESTKEKVIELEFLTQQMKRQLAIMEGTKLEALPTPELKALAQSSRKTAHKATTILTKRLEDEAYHLRRLRDCSVCMDAQIDTVCLPCGHLCLCEGCAQQLNSRCVICNTKVQKMQKVFLK